MNGRDNEYRPFANCRKRPFFCTLLSEVKGMRNWVERLVDCGIPEGTAQKVVDFFFKNRRTVELIAYVRMTEEATRK